RAVARRQHPGRHRADPPQKPAGGLARLKRVQGAGSLPYGSQTPPADGNCAMILAGRERALDISRDSGIEIQVISYGQSRSKPAPMPMAPVPAARKALDDAGLRIYEVTGIKNPNPFVDHDTYFSRMLYASI